MLVLFTAVSVYVPYNAGSFKGTIESIQLYISEKFSKSSSTMNDTSNVSNDALSPGKKASRPTPAD